MSLPADDLPSGYTTNAMPVPPMGSPYPPPAAPRRGLGFAIASLILGVFGLALVVFPLPFHLIAGSALALLAIVFGHIGFGQARRADSNAGRALAGIGLALGYLSAGLFLLNIARDFIILRSLHPFRLRHPRL